MSRPLDPVSTIMDAHLISSQQAELAVLRARVAQLERDLAEQKWMTEAIKTMAFGTASAVGQEFLQTLLRQVCAILKVRYVFVTEWLPGHTDRLRTVAGWCGDHAAEPIEYEVSDTPCQRVFQCGDAFFPCGVQQLFPQDKYLAALDIESYMGVSLLDRAGQVTGQLCVMDVRPFRFDDSQGKTILRIFAARVAVEMERLRVETALRRREERFRTLYDDNPSMYFTLSPEGTVLSVNRFGAEQLGYTADELIGQSVLAVFDPLDHQTVLSQLQQCTCNPRRTFEWEIQKLRKDGTRLWVHERARMITDTEGALTVLIVCEDVTEHRKTTQLLATLVRESPLPIVGLDANGQVMSWNQAATRLFGWTKEEVLGHELPYVPTGQGTAADALWEQGTQNAVQGPIELRRCRKDGTLLDLLLWPVFVYGENGNLSTAIGIYVDQSDLKRAELTLAESEQAIRDLQEVASDPNLTLDQRIQRVLEIGCRRFNLPIGIVTKLEGEHLNLTHVCAPGTAFQVGMSVPLCRTYCSAVMPVDDPVCFEHAGASEWRHHPGYQTLGLECYLGAKLVTGTHVHGTICFFRQDPRSRPFSQPEKDFLLLMARWISGELYRRNSEQALKEQEALLRSVIDTAIDAIFMKDHDGRYQFINSSGALVIGRCPEEIIGKNDTELFPADTASRFIADDQEVFSGAVKRRVEEIITLKGESRTFYTIKSPHRDQSGQVVGLVGVARDMTDLKRAEEALRQSEARLNRFVANAPVGLVILGEDKRVICANKALCELTGYTEQEILGNTYDLYTHPEDLAANLILTDEFYKGVRSEYAYEKRYIRKSGEIIWVSIKATRVELPGHSGPLLLAVVQDITERKLAAEEREQLSRDLHDSILQSLYAVGMQLEASKIALGKSPKRSKTHMTHAIEHLNHLMLEVRQYITLLTQRTAPKPDFGQALRLLVASLSATGQAAPELQIEDPVLSLVTPTQGEQLLNIAREALSNSMRHARATRRSVRLSSTKRTIRLVIRDDGVGFFLRGRGLRGHGLTNMAARAKNICARLTIHSAPSKGTRVTIEVPVEKGAANA